MDYDRLHIYSLGTESVQNHQSSTVCTKHSLITEDLKLEDLKSRICFIGCTEYICTAYKNTLVTARHVT